MTAIQVGTRLAGSQVEYLPVTSRVEMNGSEYLRKQNGRWMQIGYPNNNWTWRDWITPHQVVTVKFVPVQAEVPDRLTETYDQWESRFLAAVRKGASDNGVRESTINKAFEDIGIDITRTTEGPRNPGDVTYGGSSLVTAPDGTLVSVLSNGMVYKKSGHYWYRRTPTPERRERNIPNESVMLVRWGPDGPTDLVEPNIDENERLRLKTTKARAWKVAMRMKASHSWCSTLESIVNSGGVFATDAMGDGLNKDLQRNQPVGTYLFFADVITNEWSILKRTSTARNRAGTAYVLGTATANTQPYADVVQRPGEEWDPPTWVVLNASRAVRQIATPENAGLQFGLDTSRYMVCQDGRITSGRTDGQVPATGQWNHESFGVGSSTMTLVSLGATS